MELPRFETKYICVLGKHKSIVVLVTKFNGGQVTVMPIGKVNAARTSHKRPKYWTLPLDAFNRRYRRLY